MKKPSVTVVIAYHNGSGWIERALESVLIQTIQADEIIVVDDGSSEEHSLFLRSLSEKYQFKLLYKENGGQSSARNYGISQSSSEYICLLDQDDYFLPRHIEALIAVADFNDPRFAYSYGDLWRETESGLVISHSAVNREVKHPHKDLTTLIGSNMYILPSATLINKALFQKVGGYDPELRGYEDDDLFLRFFTSGYSNRFTQEAVTVWTLNTSSTSFSESMARSRFLYFKKLLNIFPEGSVVGVRIFGDHMYRRFAYQFAADVIEAAFQSSDSFSERVERLDYFRTVLKGSHEVSPRTKKHFLSITSPLVRLSVRNLRLFLKLVLYSGVLSVFGSLEGRGEFVRRYLPRKKSL